MKKIMVLQIIVLAEIAKRHTVGWIDSQDTMGRKFRFSFLFERIDKTCRHKERKAIKKGCGESAALYDRYVIPSLIVQITDQVLP